MLAYTNIQVSTNGLISFGRGFEESTPEVFPSTNPDTFWRYLVAPFWADFNSTNGGSVSYAIYTSENSGSLLSNVSQLIQSETSDGDFVGSWMLVGYWENLLSEDGVRCTLVIDSVKEKKLTLSQSSKLFFGDTYIIHSHCTTGEYLPRNSHNQWIQVLRRLYLSL